MESFGVLYNSTTNKQLENLSSEVHVNFWKLPRRWNQYDRYVDFGIRINDQSSTVDSISVYCPFEIKDDQLKDLGGVLVRENFVEVLLNGSYEVRTNMCPCYHFVGTLEREKSFWIYELNKESFSIQKIGNGSLITIAIKSRPDFDEIKSKTSDEKILSREYNLYIRFRVALKGNEYSTIEALSNDFIQNAFSKVELINLHLNDKREIPSSTYERLKDDNRYFLPFSLCQFFFCGSSKDDVDTCQSSYKDSRIIDKTIWAEYIGNISLKDTNCIMYHWKFDSLNGTCNLFFRSKFTSYSIWTLIKYIIVVVFLGYIGSLLVAITPGVSSTTHNGQVGEVSQTDTISVDKKGNLSN